MCVQAAIANAKSLDEVQRLEMLLKTGHVPGQTPRNEDEDEVEMEVSNGR